uniref:LITAF domain-containing protein n=1 Tax=Panagrellus redivivus TaxID=6233 RepID=A0A7E4VQY5_PANRE
MLRSITCHEIRRSCCAQQLHFLDVPSLPRHSKLPPTFATPVTLRIHPLCRFFDLVRYQTFQCPACAMLLNANRMEATKLKEFNNLLPLTMVVLFKLSYEIEHAAESEDEE